MGQDRHEKGIEALTKITGSSGEAVVEGLKDIAPDLADWIIEFSYGDILSRPNIDVRLRQFVSVAALTAMATATPQLRVQINGALNVGCRPEEIIEVILQMAIFAGFPAVINAINTVREVFKERNIKIS